jgi:hypothetical protein
VAAAQQAPLVATTVEYGLLASPNLSTAECDNDRNRTPNRDRNRDRDLVCGDDVQGAASSHYEAAVRVYSNVESDNCVAGDDSSSTSAPAEALYPIRATDIGKWLACECCFFGFFGSALPCDGLESIVESG